MKSLDSKESAALKFLLCSGNIDTSDILSRMHNIVEIRGGISASHKDAYIQSIAWTTGIMTHMWMHHDFTIYSHNIQYVLLTFLFSSNLTFQPAALYTLLYLLCFEEVQTCIFIK